LAKTEPGSMPAAPANPNSRTNSLLEIVIVGYPVISKIVGKRRRCAGRYSEASGTQTTTYHPDPQVQA